MEAAGDPEEDEFGGVNEDRRLVGKESKKSRKEGRDSKLSHISLVFHSEVEQGIGMVAESSERLRLKVGSNSSVYLYAAVKAAMQLQKGH